MLAQETAQHHHLPLGEQGINELRGGRCSHRLHRENRRKNLHVNASYWEASNSNPALHPGGAEGNFYCQAPPVFFIETEKITSSLSILPCKSLSLALD